MLRAIGVLLIGVLLSPSAFAAPAPTLGFDCHKTTSAMEQVICSDTELAALDQTWSEKFTRAKKENPEDSQYIIDNEKNFLKDRLEQCTPHAKDEMPTEENKAQYVSCLKRIYKKYIDIISFKELWPPFRETNVDKAIARLRTMGPDDLADIMTEENQDILSELSCRFFEKDPQAASDTFGTFGGRADGWIPLCQIDIADRVPEVKALFTALEPIWGAGTECDGTVGYTHNRLEMIVRMLAAVDPNPMNNETVIEPLNSATLGYTPDLKHWSQQGHWEKRQYEALQPILEKARAALSQYYRASFHVPQAQANAAAEFHITQIIRERTEHTGASQTPSYMSLCFDRNDLDAYLKTNLMPTKTCPYGEYVDMSKEATLRRFLGLAIINQYPLDTIKKIIADGAELNQKRDDNKGSDVVNDSPLMLAVPYPEIISLLLKARANVNEPNAFGKTALMYAIQERNVQSVSLLLDAHTDVNAKTAEDIACSALKAGNRTPLMYAAWQSTPEIIKMIVAAKVDLNAKDTNGETALNYLNRNETLRPEEKLTLEKILQPSAE